jgi:hypothetical protein
MKVSGGHFLSPVQKLVATIFFFRSSERKCKSSPVARTQKRSSVNIHKLTSGFFVKSDGTMCIAFQVAGAIIKANR